MPPVAAEASASGPTLAPASVEITARCFYDPRVEPGAAASRAHPAQEMFLEGQDVDVDALIQERVRRYVERAADASTGASSVSKEGMIEAMHAMTTVKLLTLPSP